MNPNHDSLWHFRWPACSSAGWLRLSRPADCPRWQPGHCRTPHCVAKRTVRHCTALTRGAAHGTGTGCTARAGRVRRVLAVPRLPPRARRFGASEPSPQFRTTLKKTQQPIRARRLRSPTSERRRSRRLHAQISRGKIRRRVGAAPALAQPPPGLADGTGLTATGRSPLARRRGCPAAPPRADRRPPTPRAAAAQRCRSRR
jgi:hypothetical protein